MRYLIAALLLAMNLPVAKAASSDWNFRVLLDGREVGQHQFTLATDGQAREVRSEAEFNVRVLFINAYSYLHEAVERWQGDCLRSLEARTETNGKHQVVSASMRDGRLSVVRAEGRERLDGCVMSFAYWNPDILDEQQLLNSQTGELMPVTITEQGVETVAVRGELRRATRHRISGEQLQIDVWYANGQWIALEALAQGGRVLRYELT